MGPPVIHRERERQREGAGLHPPALETGEAAGGLPAGHFLAGDVGADDGEGQRGHRRAIPHPWVVTDRLQMACGLPATGAGGSAAAVLVAAVLRRSWPAASAHAGWNTMRQRCWRSWLWPWWLKVARPREVGGVG
jgi:hypothetical protein